MKYHLSVPEEGAAAVIPVVGSSPRALEPSALSTCQLPKAEALTYFSVSVIFTLQLFLWLLRQKDLFDLMLMFCLFLFLCKEMFICREHILRTLELIRKHLIPACSVCVCTPDSIQELV